MPPKRILLVDDEPNVVKSCAKMLELEGFSVKGVTSGTEAIDSYRHDHFDLVLTDLEDGAADLLLRLPWKGHLAFT